MSVGIGILSILTVFLTALPPLDVNVIPQSMRHIGLHVKLIDIVIIISWLFLSILCVRSFLSQLKTKPRDMEFRMLFYNSLFESHSQFFKNCVPAWIILLTASSLWYIWTIINYTYQHWTLEFATILHALQMFPAIFMIFQSVCQSCFLLWTYSLPSYRETVRNDDSIQNVLCEHICLNLALALHCICLSAIAYDKISGLWWFSICEISYRLFATASLFNLINTTSTNTVLALETAENKEKSERV